MKDKNKILQNVNKDELSCEEQDDRGN